ncbi:SMI1/KNR4 family protein [Spirillospora sp. NPDC052269]
MTNKDALRRAGLELAESLHPLPEDAFDWPPRFPDGPIPDDYVALLSRTGPGTVAGVLQLLAPGAVEGFDMTIEQHVHAQPHPEARLWGVFSSGETCWWLPIDDAPERWLVVLDGNGYQQLNLTTTEFIDEWLDGLLDLPVLSLGPAKRPRTWTRAGQPIRPEPLEAGRRDPLAQLSTIIGPGVSATYDWEAIEREVGVPRLPNDYKRFFETYGGDGVPLQGIFLAFPDTLAKDHRAHAGLVDNLRDHRRVAHSEPGGLLFCGSTEGRDILFWDTAGPDPDRWPVVNAAYGGIEKFGPLTELLVAELTGVGLGLVACSLGNPAEWAWPHWGPRPRRF